MNLNEYIVFVIGRKCNNRCDICFIDGTDEELADLHAVSMPFFRKFLELIPEGKYSGIIFSGGEPTMNEQLSEYASYAKDKGFHNIMIQTNARMLSDFRRAKQLKAAGVNHFFVSFHSADKDISDRMAGVYGAHAQSVRALENLDRLELSVITNTVMTSMNYKGMPKIGRFLKKFRNILEMHFWGYTPMSSKASELMLPYAVAAPYLNQAIEYIITDGRNVCVKWFPICLLEESYRKYHSNDQPNSLGIIDKFLEKKFNSCNFQKCPCCERTDCLGLPEVYRNAVLPGKWMPSFEAGGTN